MSLQIINGDITKLEVDAIVNAANKTLLGGGGVDGAIHKAAGIKLLFECMKLGGCKVGQAKITAAYNLPSKYVVHTVGPKYKKGNTEQEKQLYDCYYNSLCLAGEYGVRSVAFPLISAGIYGYPEEEVIIIAKRAISKYLETNNMDVYIVIFER